MAKSLKKNYRFHWNTQLLSGKLGKKKKNIYNDQQFILETELLVEQHLQVEVEAVSSTPFCIVRSQTLVCKSLHIGAYIAME